MVGSIVMADILFERGHNKLQNEMPLAMIDQDFMEKIEEEFQNINRSVTNPPFLGPQFLTCDHT
jgi:hypothetical protein